MSELTDALDTLADMFEYGHLQAQTDPVGFIRSVQDRITELEKEVAYYEQENKYIKAVVEQNDRLRAALEKASEVVERLIPCEGKNALARIIWQVLDKKE